MSLITTPVHAAETRRSAVQQFHLDNGLQAVWEVDARQPLVAIEARIEGGLRGEGRYLGTGITHFIEHMLFKGTPTREPGSIDQEVRRYGGSINAFTSFDSTGVSLFVESRHTRDALAMLSDILQHAVFPPEEFEKERAVVISEIQMNADDPDRHLNQMLWSRHYLEHPYKHPILGYQPRLEALTVQDMADFYRAQYQPQRITLSVVGDIDPAAMPGMIRELFGEWVRGPEDPLQEMVAPEPPTVTAKDTVETRQVQTAYGMLGFPSVTLYDPDLYALDVLASILGKGRSSRMYETLVRQRQLVQTIECWDYTPHDPGIFGVSFRADDGQADAARAAIVELIAQVQQRGVTEAELAKAKKQVTAEYVFSLQTIESKAGDLANSLMSTGDPLFSRRYVEGVGRVTAAEVQAVAQRYLDPRQMTTAMIRPAQATLASDTPRAEPASIVITKTTLANGGTLLVGVDQGLPIATAVVAFKGGVRVESADRQGLSNLVAHMLVRGTKKRSGLEIAQAVESLGGSIQPFSGRDGFGLVLQVLAEDADTGVALLHELVTESAFTDEEVGRQRALIVQQIQADEDESFQVSGKLLRRTLFDGHPYGFDPLGTPETVGRFTRKDCLDFAKQWIAPANMVVAVFGDIDPASAGGSAAKTFGNIPSRPSAWPDRLPATQPAGIRLASKTVEREQAVIMLGFLGSTYTAPDRYDLDVLTAVLSGMAGRLFQAVREEHGLSYTLGAVNVAGWDPGYVMVYAATRPGERDRVIGLLESSLNDAVATGFTAEEVEQAKRHLIGEHRLDIQRLVGLVRRSAVDELFGLGFEAWRQYEDRINAVTVDAVHNAAKHYLRLDQRAQVTVGPNESAVHVSE